MQKVRQKSHNAQSNLFSIRAVNSLKMVKHLSVVPLQHNVEQSVPDIFSRHGQSHQLHTGDVQGVGCGIGELIEPPVTVGEGAG